MRTNVTRQYFVPGNESACERNVRPSTFWRTWLRPSHMSVNPIVFDKKSLLFPDAYAFFLFLFQRLRLESFVVFTNKEI